LDVDLVRDALGANEVHVAREDEFATRFPDCEVGAEPPFGQLYGLPVLLEQSLDQEEPLIVRAGSHEETVELSFDNLRALETPIVARIADRRVVLDLRTVSESEQEEIARLLAW